ncbi:MAG: hypothetical protein WC653_02900 [Candidatus Gracilibacteria bacterium]
MIGSESIDLELGSVWKAWFEFRKGKRMSEEMHQFQYGLEENLFQLHQDLNNGTYKHGSYRHFIVCDNKRREISVSYLRYGDDFVLFEMDKDKLEDMRMETIKIRIANKLDLRNTSSYYGVVSKHGGPKIREWLDWQVHELIS